MRLHRPWKVPTHMPRVLIGSIAEMRASISLAALLVKVTAMRPCGLAWPVWISHATRVVSTRVLPLPAPARIRADWWGSVTASSCRSLREERKSGDIERGIPGGNYSARARAAAAIIAHLSSRASQPVLMQQKYDPHVIEREAQAEW